MQFRTKARAVDLLGKGQIADLPTAITELWKNGYDAYADNLKAELFKKGYQGLENDYFIISDDGKGMSNMDIIDKWLVLGTDSKSRAELDIESEDTLWKKPRIKAGEKGIGRLSIAYLGNPMLMLTKKLGYPLQALYFDWRLLENYNLFLDDIIIPIKPVETNDSLQEVFKDLKKIFIKNFEKEIDLDNKPVWEGKQVSLKEDIITDTNNARLENVVYESINNFFNNENSHGTIFLTFNPIDQILDLAEKDEERLDDKEFILSSLFGFTNDFKDQKKIFNVSFKIFDDDDEAYELLDSAGNFFDFNDYSLADVIIKGEFDGNGNFDGELTIYDKTIDYLFSTIRNKSRKNYYGPCKIELGYSQGFQSESKLDEFSWKKINDKVVKHGGLYLYRDNFRVLPYGRTDFDFLGFEKRRAKHAGSSYFSHRRMFGYIEITKEFNPYLIDKSSREGLTTNSQYNAFRKDLEFFFISLANEFFGTKAKQSIFLDMKKDLKDQNDSLKADKSREKAEKIAFTKSLNEYPKKLEEHQLKYEDLLNQLELKLDNFNVTYSEVESILDELQKLDIEFKSLLPKVPKRYKPTETQQERLYKFEDRLTNFTKYVKPRREILNNKAQDKLEIRDLKIDFTKKYNSYIASLDKELNINRQVLEKKVDSLIKEYRERSRNLIKALSENKEETINDIISKEQVSSYTDKMLGLYSSLLNQAQGTLFPLVEHINRLSFDIDEEQVQGAYKAQYDQMKYQWDQTRDTAQLGIAVEIIDHEFNQLYAKINNQLNVLSINEVIQEIKEFHFLERNFKQLEDKYALLSPLYRISGSQFKDVNCNAIFEYLEQFFENQISDYNIQFDVSEPFKQHSLRIKEPVIYTVFINIINNAIYWMRNKEQRIIKLDYLPQTQEIIIANSGEKIPDYRLDKVFELFYSNRPNGRGIGLYLSKQSLNEAGLDILAVNDKKYNTLNGASFIIAPIKI